MPGISRYTKSRLLRNTMNYFECRICYEDLAISPVKCFTCESVFCKSCITDWTKKPKSNQCPNQCPSKPFKSASLTAFENRQLDDMRKVNNPLLQKQEKEMVKSRV